MSETAVSKIAVTYTCVFLSLQIQIPVSEIDAWISAPSLYGSYTVCSTRVYPKVPGLSR
jgi:hypothetical protein